MKLNKKPLMGYEYLCVHCKKYTRHIALYRDGPNTHWVCAECFQGHTLSERVNE